MQLETACGCTVTIYTTRCDVMHVLYTYTIFYKNGIPESIDILIEIFDCCAVQVHSGYCTSQIGKCQFCLLFWLIVGYNKLFADNILNLYFILFNSIVQMASFISQINLILF